MSHVKSYKCMCTHRLAYLPLADTPCTDTIQRASVYIRTNNVSYETLHQVVLGLAACALPKCMCTAKVHLAVYLASDWT